MKILLIGSFRFEMYAPAFAYGFRQLGHEIIEIDYEQYHLKGNSPLVSLHNRFQDRYHYGLMMGRYNQAIIDIVEQENPEVVFLYRCYHIYSSTLKAIKGKSVVMSYNNDDPFSAVPSKSYYRYHIANASICDLNYVYRKKNREDYALLGINNTKILLPYYQSRVNVPIECEKDIEIAFVGHYEPDGRDSMIKRLKDEGIPIQLYGGEQWKESPLYTELSEVFQGEVKGEAYNRLLNRVRILLVFFSKHNHDTYTRRCFEIPAAKGVMLSEYTDDMNALFPGDTCAVYFRDKEELVNKAKWLIANPDKQKLLAKNAYQRVKELGASEIDRCREIIDDYNEIKKNKSI